MAGSRRHRRRRLRPRAGDARSADGRYERIQAPPGRADVACVEQGVRQRTADADRAAVEKRMSAPVILSRPFDFAQRRLSPGGAEDGEESPAETAGGWAALVAGGSSPSSTPPGCRGLRMTGL